MMAQAAIDGLFNYPSSIIARTAEAVMPESGNVLEHTLTVLRNPFQDVRVFGVGSTERILILVFVFHVCIIPQFERIARTFWIYFPSLSPCTV